MRTHAASVSPRCNDKTSRKRVRLCGSSGRRPCAELRRCLRQKAPKHRGTTTHGAGKRNTETQTSHKQRLRDKTLRDVLQNSSTRLCGGRMYVWPAVENLADESQGEQQAGPAQGPPTTQTIKTRAFKARGLCTEYTDVIWQGFILCGWSL